MLYCRGVSENEVEIKMSMNRSLKRRIRKRYWAQSMSRRIWLFVWEGQRHAFSSRSRTRSPRSVQRSGQESSRKSLGLMPGGTLTRTPKKPPQKKAMKLPNAFPTSPKSILIETHAKVQDCKLQEALHRRSTVLPPLNSQKGCHSPRRKSKQYQAPSWTW